MKNIIITGCNRGLGYTLAENFLNQGYTVHGFNRHPRSTMSPTGTPQANHVHHSRPQINMRSTSSQTQVNPSQPKAYHDNLWDATVNYGIPYGDTVYGDVLILCHTMFYSTPFEEITADIVNDIFLTNVCGSFNLLKDQVECNKELKKVIIIGSQAENFYMKDSELYSISKKAFHEMITAYYPILKKKGIQLCYITLGRLGCGVTSIDVTNTINEIVNTNSQYFVDIVL